MWILAVPLLDMVRVMFIRLRRGDSMFDADREHLHHFLLERGASHHATAAIVIAVSALAGLIGVGGWLLGVPEWLLSYAFIALFAAVLASGYIREKSQRTA